MPIAPVDADASRLTRPVAPVAAVARAVATRDSTDASAAPSRSSDPRLDATPPNLGPYRIGGSGGFQLVVYSEPLLRTGLQPAIADRGQVFDERA